MALTAKAFLDMSQQELDDMFRASEVGPIPSGDAVGTAIVKPGTALADIAAPVVSGLAWQGKVFDPTSGTLRNKITPLGVKEIVAKVYIAPSWFDGRDCVVLDYSDTSFVAHSVRDEIREVSPGLYLGIVFISRKKTINFALQFGGGPETTSLWRRVKASLSALLGRLKR
ncbi:MAG: hypothetical protein ABIQ47_10955 [Tepidiformaceae bacterium]